MKAISGRRFCRLLEQRGWELKRIQGSHHIYGKSGHLARLSIPVHRNQTLKQGLQRHLMKIAGIGDDDL